MKQIILVRHGQAENHLLNSMVGGWSDVSLTELGLKQAESVAKRLVEELNGESKLYSSDLNRARQTAEIISESLDMVPIYAIELRELNSGITSGMDRKEAEKYLVKVKTPTLDWRPYPESESFGEFYTRVSTFMDKLIETEDRVLIVSHGGAIQNIIRWWLGTPSSNHFKVEFETANASVTVLDTTQYNVRRVERLNDTSHYAAIGTTNPIE
jgi:probable phosphoglycerate mutase